MRVRAWRYMVFVLFASCCMARADSVEPDLLEVRFVDDQQIRLRDYEPKNVGSGPALQSVRSRATMQRLRNRGVQWRRSYELASEEYLDNLRGPRNLNQYFRLKVPSDQIEATIADLESLPEVDKVFRVPKPAPPPAAPDYSNPANGSGYWARYLDAAPSGVDARYAWSNGVTGAGVKICDIEYEWNKTHVDLPTVTYFGPVAIPYDKSNHGTAVLGVMFGKDNGTGVKGIAYDAAPYFTSPYTWSYWGYNVGAAILASFSVLTNGDILLIEQQIPGPTNEFVPVEWYEPWYDAIRAAVSNGIIVVEAGANGGQNLDSAAYSTGNGGHHPFLPENRSGAIIVGAGNAPQDANPRKRASFSNYGSAVLLQGTGGSVVTAGFGDLYSAEGTNAHYTLSFSGTSSASPIVAGAAALVQQFYRERYGVSATPAQMLTILERTGTPQEGTDHIGPFPDVRTAIEDLLSRDDVDEDGIPDAWELGRYGTIRHAPAWDGDGDGFTLLEEYIADTAPQDSNSYFRAEGISLSPLVSVSFASATGRVYRLEYSDDFMGDTWEAVPGLSNVLGVGGAQILTDTNAASSRRYRLRVWLDSP